MLDTNPLSHPRIEVGTLGVIQLLLDMWGVEWFRRLISPASIVAEDDRVADKRIVEGQEVPSFPDRGKYLEALFTLAEQQVGNKRRNVSNAKHLGVGGNEKEKFCFAPRSPLPIDTLSEATPALFELRMRGMNMPKGPYRSDFLLSWVTQFWFQIEGTTGNERRKLTECIKEASNGLELWYKAGCPKQWKEVEGTGPLSILMTLTQEMYFGISPQDTDEQLCLLDSDAFCDATSAEMGEAQASFIYQFLDNLAAELGQELGRFNVLDNCCGTGAGMIAMARQPKCEGVVGMELDPRRVNLAKHNVTIMKDSGNISAKVDILQGSFHDEPHNVEGLQNRNFNLLFTSPPWGGPSYSRRYPNRVGNDIRNAIMFGKGICDHIFAFLPFNIEFTDLARLGVELGAQSVVIITALRVSVSVPMGVLVGFLGIGNGIQGKPIPFEGIQAALSKIDSAAFKTEPPDAVRKVRNKFISKTRFEQDDSRFLMKLSATKIQVGFSKTQSDNLWNVSCTDGKMLRYQAEDKSSLMLIAHFPFKVESFDTPDYNHFDTFGGKLIEAVRVYLNEPNKVKFQEDFQLAMDMFVPVTILLFMASHACSLLRRVSPDKIQDNSLEKETLKFCITQKKTRRSRGGVFYQIIKEYYPEVFAAINKLQKKRKSGIGN